MDNSFKKKLVIFVLLLATLSVRAWEPFRRNGNFTYYDGLFYLLNDNKAALTWEREMDSFLNLEGGYTYSFKQYVSGDVVIPESFFWRNVFYPNSENKEYIVNGIDSCAFCSQYDLTSIKIPSTVEYIAGDAFNFCKSLKIIEFGENVKSIGKGAFYNCPSIRKIYSRIVNPFDVPEAFDEYIGSDVTLYVPIGTKTQYEKLKGWDRFSNIEELESLGCFIDGLSNGGFFTYTTVEGVVMVFHVLSFEDKTLEVHALGTSAIDKNTSGAVTIPSSIYGYNVVRIGQKAFYRCEKISYVKVPETVMYIDKDAFYGNSSTLYVDLPDNILSLFPNQTGGYPRFFVNKGSVSTLSLWNSHCAPYDKETKERLLIPCLLLSNRSQTTITLKIENIYDTFIYKLNSQLQSNDVVVFDNLCPEHEYDFNLEVSLEGKEKTFNFNLNCTTEDILVSSSVKECTATSLRVNGQHTKLDEGTEIIEEKMAICLRSEYTVTTNMPLYYVYYRGANLYWYYYLIQEEVNGSSIYLKGLAPGGQYYCIHKMTVTNGDWSVTSIKATDCGKIKALILTTSQPKVISAGNVIVAAETNMDNEETNVGFEWRRIDWTDDFASNKGNAYLYNGTMEGYIRNLYTEKLWKYRPYYTSNAGNTYYGEWVGIDPTNTSYFEPTVHTYANVSVNGNSAEVKGYVQRGTDNVVSKGFAYWKQSQGVKSREAMAAPSKISSVPSSAKAVEVSGSQQVMTASISDLEYETTYCYVAFLRTSEGDTFYGEEQSFSTGDGSLDIGGIMVDASDSVPVKIVARYNMNGQPITSPQPGVNILRMSDGSVKKVMVK